MPDTALDLSTMAPLTHDEACDLQATEYDRLVDLLAGLPAEAWTTPTPDCPDWDVRRMVLHLVGACESSISKREMLHQLRAGRAYVRAGRGPLEAGLSACQVADRDHLDGPAALGRLGDVAPRAVRARRRTPKLLRAVRTKVDAPVAERWALGYLLGPIYLRDAWMHRVDIARATGAHLLLDAEHDGRIVADVAAEWARRHGRSVRLTLSGPAGGSFVAGDPTAGEDLELDAVAFCRALAGREPAEGLLRTVVPF